jgi:hypothetical protein
MPQVSQFFDHGTFFDRKVLIEHRGSQRFGVAGALMRPAEFKDRKVTNE